MGDFKGEHDSQLSRNGLLSCGYFHIIQANLRFCAGTSCVLSWVTCALGGKLRYVILFTHVEVRVVV